MDKVTHLFLDFDDTLVDSKEHNRQYVSALAKNLCEEHGGEISVWSRAIATGISGMKQRYLWHFNEHNLEDFNIWMDIERVATTMGIFQLAGITYPEVKDMLRYAVDMQFTALTTCNAAHEGVKPALEALSDLGFELHAASANESEYLRGAFVGMGLGALVKFEFGPNLVHCAKEDKRFYKDIFDYVQADPSQVIVVDDQIECLKWATEMGAMGIHANIGGIDVESEFATMTHFSQLPELVMRMHRR